MILRLRFTPSSRVQFLAAIAYIQADKPVAAQRFRDRAEQVLRRLERFPQSGRVIPEFPDLPHREVIVSPYRFFYRVTGKTVWVLPCGTVHNFRGNPFLNTVSSLLKPTPEMVVCQ